MNRMRKTIVGAGLVLTTLTGGVVGATLIGSASAQTASGSATSTTAAQPANFDPAKGGHVGANGVAEKLLTGDDATKATNAALAAVPGATIQRVETDAEGVYEAHIVKSDGTMATVQMDANFKVTGVEAGPSGGHGPAGAPAPASAAG